MLRQWKACSDMKLFPFIFMMKWSGENKSKLECLMVKRVCISLVIKDRISLSGFWEDMEKNSTLLPSICCNCTEYPLHDCHANLKNCSLQYGRQVQTWFPIQCMSMTFVCSEECTVSQCLRGSSLLSVSSCIKVLGTDGGGTKEIVTYNVTGLLHPVGRPGTKVLAQNIWKEAIGN